MTTTASIAHDPMPRAWQPKSLPIDTYKELAEKIRIEIDMMPVPIYSAEFPWWGGKVTAEAEFDGDYTIIVNVDLLVKFEKVVAPDMIYYEPIEVRHKWTNCQLFDQYGDERSCDFDLRYFISLITY